MAGKKQLEGKSAVEKLLRRESEPDALSNEGNNASDNILDNILDNTSDSVLSNTSNNILHNTNNNILNNIISNIVVKEPAGGNHTFYLSTEVADKLSQTAKSMNISKSKLVDSILREILVKNVTAEKEALR